jgi:hypothetical protein
MEFFGQPAPGDACPFSCAVKAGDSNWASAPLRRTLLPVAFTATLPPPRGCAMVSHVSRATGSTTGSKLRRVSPLNLMQASGSAIDYHVGAPWLPSGRQPWH